VRGELNHSGNKAEALSITPFYVPLFFQDGHDLSSKLRRVRLETEASQNPITHGK
jgi:hypothetical protein